MPELPEVETVRRGLAPVLEGAKITGVQLNRADLRFPFPANFASRLEGRTVASLSRRAKYLIAELDDGLRLISHLGMSGSWRIGGATPGVFHYARSKDTKHDHVIVTVSNANGELATVTYNDPRRFGFLLFAEKGEEHPLLANLGQEPLGNAFDSALLARLFDGRAAPLKSALLDQKLIAGLGNIYVCEALHRSGLSPLRPAGRLSAAEAGTLAAAVRSVLGEAVEAGGSSLRDHRQADGSLGYFQHRFSVYDREDEPCPRKGCKGRINRVVQAGRSTFYCPSCQK
ncbi:MAG: bifunctional DNA-formamidopyrimidine glycosylase/DNA-(apurinic or apyrimidinic site) lyase [Rhizobiaceae bacterium]